MSNEPKQAKIKRLEVNKETVAELSEQEAEGVNGGAAGRNTPTGACMSDIDTCAAVSGGCTRQ